MHRVRNLYSQIYDFENLYQAYLQARKGKRYRIEVMKFTNHLEENLIQLQDELIWKTYSVGRYREFFVYEPKRRLIMALPFRDRVVQWAIYRVLNQHLEKRFIKDSYACRVGYGTHRAVDKLQYWLRYLRRRHERIYVLKLDVSKYFYRVDHDVLMDILKRRINDEDLLWLLEVIIRCEHTKFGITLGDHFFQGERIGGMGMPIGNLTSQMFANLYLDELDHYAKEELQIRHYIRYMDDILVVHTDKKYLWETKDRIQNFTEQILHLELNNKTAVRTISQGVEFVGFRVWPTHRKLRKKTVKKARKRIKYIMNAYKHGHAEIADISNSVQSYIGLLAHANCHNLTLKLLSGLVLKKRNDGNGHTEK